MFIIVASNHTGKHRNMLRVAYRRKEESISSILETPYKDPFRPNKLV